jgi:inorganic pyrophosphatase
MDIVRNAATGHLAGVLAPGMTERTDFWTSLQNLVATSRIVIDRPRGSRHPRYRDVEYPVDYGYLEGTSAGDGSGIDIFYGTSGGDAITGICCTIDALKRDAEVKVLYACTEQDISAIRQLMGSGPMACVVVMNPAAIHQPNAGDH